MPKTLRRNWLQLTITFALLAVGAVWVTWPFALPKSATGQVQPAETEGTDLRLYSRIQSLREELHLTTVDLAAMGCDQAAAEQVLTSLKSWYQTNAQQLQQHDSAVQDTRRALRQTMRQINIGPPDQSVIDSLPRQREALAAAITQRKQFLETAESQAISTLDLGARAIRDAVKANPNLPDRLRYVPDLTDDQIKQLRQISRDAARGKITDRTTAEEQVLQFDQRAMLTEAQSNLNTHAAAVSAAEEAVLPLPDELRVNR